MENSRIDLAHEPDFTIGRLSVHPSTRELSLEHERLVIEPRVMQVLVALHRVAGTVVSKDDLAHSCWDGRVVGEDAINRVLSRLRKVSDGIGKGTFRIETVTRVGYRLIAEGEADRPAAPVLPSAKTRQNGVDRRKVLVGAGAAILGVGGGWLLYHRRPSVPSELANLIDKADSALDYGTPEQNDAAVGIMREAARLYPQRAEAWGRLAIAYRQQRLNSRRADALNITNLAQAAARRAIQIDPGNADGSVVTAIGNGLWYSTYPEYDRRTLNVLARFPDHQLARRARAGFLFETGRIRESIDVGAPLVDASLPSPAVTSHAMKLWSAGRPDEAEDLLEALIERWPRHYSIWASRYKFFLFSGKIKQAELMLAETPVGLDDIDFEILRAQTVALRTGDANDIQAALRSFDGIAPKIITKAQEAASFASAVEQLGVAFAYTDLFLFSGKWMNAYRKNVAANELLPHSGTMTFFLFEPPMKAARNDPRFDQLMTRLGLKEYWREANVTPDYLV